MKEEVYEFLRTIPKGIINKIEDVVVGTSISYNYKEVRFKK